MSSKSILIHLKTSRDAAGVTATQEQIDKLARDMKGKMSEANRSMTRGWADFKAAADMALGAVRRAVSAVASAISSSFRFEMQTRQFKILVGGIDEARAHMADLKALGDTPPFDIDQFARASRALLVMSDGALGYKKSLELIGDAAAATGHPIEALASSVGYLYASIRDGRDISRAVLQLRRMGVITPEVTEQLKEMQRVGSTNAEIWSVVEDQLRRYNGAMKETEETGSGLLGAIKARWNNIVREFGDSFSGAAKTGLASLLEKLKQLEEDGSVARWGKGALTVLEAVANGLIKITEGVDDVVAHFRRGMGDLEPDIGLPDATEEEIAESEGWERRTDVSEADEHPNEYTTRSFWRKKNAEDDSWSYQTIERVDEELKARLEAEKREKEEQERLAEDLARHQAEIDERRAKEEAEKQAAEEARAAEKKAAEDARAAEKAARAEESARLKAEAAVHRQKMADIRAEMKAQQDAGAARQSIAEAARTEFDRAFAMYRDPEKAADAIAEERSYQEDLSRLHRDASRYGGKWRIEELSRLMSAGDSQGVTDTLQSWRRSSSFTPEVEAMIRASAAEKTKTTAEDELRKIAINTAGLSEKLDQLLMVKG